MCIQKYTAIYIIIFVKNIWSTSLEQILQDQGDRQAFLILQLRAAQSKPCIWSAYAVAQ